MDVRNTTEVNTQIKWSNLFYSTETKLKVAKKFKTRLSNPIQIRFRKIFIIQIHRKAENPPDLDPNPCSPLISIPLLVGDESYGLRYSL